MLALVLLLIIIPIERIDVRAERPGTDLQEEIANESESDISEDESDVLGSSYNIGDIIRFGNYNQGDNSTKGKDEIEWQVLKVESDRVLVISKYALDYKPYNTEQIDVTWETCSLRKWLNNDFKNEAFTPQEQERIPYVNLKNENNPKWGTPGGNDTTDQIFCLSFEDIWLYYGSYSWYDPENMFGYNQKLICEATQYAIDKGAIDYTITEEDYYSFLKEKGYTYDVIGRRGTWWWLRTPGGNNSIACTVYSYGTAGAFYYNCDVNNCFAVRPVLYLKISDPKSIVLDKTSATMYFGESITLNANVLPEYATDKTVIWTSSNPEIATVIDGKVKATGIQAGNVTITAKTVNGHTAKCEITVFADDDSSNIFADIKYGSWQYYAAKAVYEKGYMTGKGTLGQRIIFSPNSDITRSEFVTSLYSMAGKPEVVYKQKFSDVNETDWFAKPVTWASDNEIVSGNPDGTFGKYGNATREQIALMLYKYAMSVNYDVTIDPSTTLDGFIDSDKVSPWAVTAVKWAVERGIVSGKGNSSEGYRIDALKGATRAECAAMINTFDEYYSYESDMDEEYFNPDSKELYSDAIEDIY